MKKRSIIASALSLALIASPVVLHANNSLITKEKYEELKAKQSLTIDESNQVEAYEKAQLEKDEAYQEKQKLKKVISDSKYLTEDHKTALTNEVEGAKLYDLIEVLPNKISTTEANDKKAFMKQLDTLKEPIRKTIYESKLDETVKNNLFSRLAAADSKDKIDALKTEVNKLISGELTEPSEDPQKTEEGKTEEGKTEEGKTEEGKTEEGKTEEGKTEEGKAKEEKAEKGKMPKTSVAATSMAVLALSAAGVLVSKKRR